MTESAEAEGKCKVADFAAYAHAVLDNGFGRHGDALALIEPVFDHDHAGMGALVIPELVEAASRTGNVQLLAAASDWMALRAKATPTPWALGIDSRIAALSSEGDVAERFYRESLDHLGRTQVGVECARGRLIYGEWLRRQNRRADARVQLRVAEEMFSAMGADGFADRARRELLATGESARKRSAETSADLTPQELQVARLARDGLSNNEIGGQLFISPRTVQYHLRKVFAKLGIRSRGELTHVAARRHRAARAQRLGVARRIGKAARAFAGAAFLLGLEDTVPTLLKNRDNGRQRAAQCRREVGGHDGQQVLERCHQWAYR